MSDLINRQDLRLMTVEEGIGHTIEYAQGWKACIDWIKTLPPAQQWIPCSERLPSARQSVILSTKEWTGEGCYWETTEYHVIWKGYRWNATYWDDEVIAWMPLPEPFEGVTE